MSFSECFWSILIYTSTFFLSVACIRFSEKRYFKKTFSFMGVIIPTVTATFRQSGTDLRAYEGIYNYIHRGGSYEIEKGWLFLNRIAPTYKALLFIAAIIFFGVSYKAICKFIRKDKWVAWLIILVVCTGFFYNGTRQAIAAAFFFWGLSFFYEKKYFKFALAVFVATLFHESAWMVLLVTIAYWWLMKRVKNVFFSICILSAVGIAGIPMLSNVMNRLGLYTSYFSDNQFVFSITFLLYALPPLYFYYRNSKFFETDMKTKYCLSLYTLIIPMQFMGMRVQFLDRVGVYFNVILAILVPMIIQGYDVNKKRHSLRGAYMLWFIFYHIIMGIVLNENGMYPYRVF